MTKPIEDQVMLVGAGPMAISHARVLKDLTSDLIIIGRGEESAKNFEEETGLEVIRGGLQKYISKTDSIPEFALVAVNGNQLGEVSRLLMEKGVKKILLEKPGGLNFSDIKSVAELTEKNGADVLLGYNRRFYASVLKAKEMIEEDGGVTSFFFEFTEWPHTIVNLNKSKEEKSLWILHNSSHVIDLAFFLGGLPTKLYSFVKGSFDWHPAGTIFTGSGKSETGALFSYHSNWDAPGRWGVEVLTQKHRFFFRPLERLRIQKLKTVAIEEAPEVDYQLDEKYKPGLYLQLDRFLKGDYVDFINIQHQASRLKIFNVIIKGGSYSKEN